MTSHRPTEADSIPPLQTGQRSCHDTEGRPVACAGSGQDGDYRAGVPWPEPRFEVSGDCVFDRLTGLEWTRNANPGEFPLTWVEALAYVRELNRKGTCGHADWRLPNRRELRSLVSHQACKPALPEGHPFRNVFPGWYWSSTTAAISPAHAWYVHMAGARMFYGGKDQSFLVWPVRGAGNGVLPQTGQRHCYDAGGGLLECAASGQDGELRMGRAWPRPRFHRQPDGMLDRLTGLVWHHDCDLLRRPASWAAALQAVDDLNRENRDRPRWRLPNINELESLVDCGRHHPALPPDAGFTEPGETYWSSTTSLYEPDWAWALYLDKGAVGVGQKRGVHFHTWAVRTQGSD